MAGHARIAKRIRAHLTDDLLKPKYRRMKSRRPYTGHCYTATEALFHLWGKRHGYQPHVLKVRGGTHWYLVGPKGDVIDLTREQFTRKPKYSRGHYCYFVTNKKGKKPSQRTTELIRRVKGQSK